MKYFLQCSECKTYHEVMPMKDVKLPTIGRKLIDGPMSRCCGRQLQKEFKHTKKQKGDAYTIIWL